MDSPTRKTLQTTFRHALEYLEELDRAPAAATASLAVLRRQLLKPLQDQGVPPAQVIDELVAGVEGGLHASSGGRFFGWVIGGCVPAALAADWLASTWDQNAALYACAPAAAVCEEVVGVWLKDLIGLPAGASFALVGGCQMAHATCLAAARHSVLADRNWDVEEKGLSGAPAVRILTGGHRHGSIERAARLLGLGRGSVEELKIDQQGRLLESALQEALLKDRSRPAIVILQAGDINIGAYDDFETLIPIAKEAGAWVHVDGAFGLWAAVSPSLKHLLKGADSADSWATDGHKWLNVPFDCGFAFVADSEAHRASMSHRASYLTHDDDARDQIDWNPDWSRRARGFPTYAALRQLGRSGVADLVDRCCRHARALVRGMGALPGAEVVWEPQINQGLVRFLNPAPESTEADHDQHTDAVIEAIARTREAFFTGTTWRGRRAMRVSVCGWQTSEADVERSVAAARQAIEKVRSGQ